MNTPIENSAHTPHKPTKRRNISAWMESRLSRLDAKIKHGRSWQHGEWAELSREELNRCRDRAHRLACDLQTIWAKRAATSKAEGRA